MTIAKGQFFESVGNNGKYLYKPIGNTVSDIPSPYNLAIVLGVATRTNQDHIDADCQHYVTAYQYKLQQSGFAHRIVTVTIGRDREGKLYFTDYYESDKPFVVYVINGDIYCTPIDEFAQEES
jgi:hypothetical protein